jgi:hypothetical protein
VRIQTVHLFYSFFIGMSIVQMPFCAKVQMPFCAKVQMPICANANANLCKSATAKIYSKLDMALTITKNS